MISSQAIYETMSLARNISSDKRRKAGKPGGGSALGEGSRVRPGGGNHAGGHEPYKLKMTQEEIRTAVLSYLKTNISQDYLHDGPLYDLAAKAQMQGPPIAGYGAVEVYAVLWSLVREGIIIPGLR